jgi:hypothetical protein
VFTRQIVREETPVVGHCASVVILNFSKQMPIYRIGRPLGRRSCNPVTEPTLWWSVQFMICPPSYPLCASQSELGHILPHELFILRPAKALGMSGSTLISNHSPPFPPFLVSFFFFFSLCRGSPFPLVSPIVTTLRNPTFNCAAGDTFRQLYLSCRIHRWG